MRNVVYALAPLYLASVWFYGWSTILLSLVVFPTAILVEYLTERAKKKGKVQVSEAVLVTSMLYLLALPPRVPYWIAMVGIAFAVFFGKAVYGGFGRNIFNPAITGRLFVYLSFPAAMGTLWSKPDLNGALWNGNFMAQLTTFLGFPPAVNPDAFTGATPLDLLRRQETVDWFNLLIGNRPGSLGEGPIILILLALVFLLWPLKNGGKNAMPTANYRMIVGTLVGGFAVMAFVWYFMPGYAKRIDPFLGMLSGSLLFCAVFMCTDPITAPKKPLAQYIYGLLAGSITSLIRLFSGFPEGSSFGILVANMFAALLDEILPDAKKAKKPAAKVPAAPEAAKEAQ